MQTTAQQNKAQVANWLMIGVGMIIVQVLLGGITRLTESGLSITEWKPITGMLPPMGDAAWQAEFDKYKGTDQFKYVHQHFSLADFKFIFFWEWFHRVWARLMGLVFLAGFIYFLLTKKFKKEMIAPMVVLFVLGGLQGTIGWLMVKSGLVPEKYYVGHVELTTHLMAALTLLAYTLWFALSLKVSPRQQVPHKGLRRFLTGIVVLLFIQLIYGGFMAGLKAAIVAPSWPSINGQWVPSGMGDMQPVLQNIFNNSLTIHFIHRGMAYLLLILVGIWWWRSAGIGGQLFKRYRHGFMALLLVQVALGILTVLNATYSNRLVWLGVAHQFTGMLLVVVVTGLLFLMRPVSNDYIANNHISKG
jgi:cytochrome c oxidase assembly protein subunit 15